MAHSMTRREFVQTSTVFAAGSAIALRTEDARAKEPPSFAEYRRHDSLSLAELVRKGDADPMELLEIAIARTEAINPAEAGYAQLESAL